MYRVTIVCVIAHAKIKARSRGGKDVFIIVQLHLSAPISSGVVYHFMLQRSRLRLRVALLLVIGSVSPCRF